MPKTFEPPKGRVVGVISDTHGLVRPTVINAFHGVDFVIHAGDIGGKEVLVALRAVAPVVAVRGNMDSGQWARELNETEVVEVGDVLLYVHHDLYGLDLDPAAAGFSAVISGHSHRPSVVHRSGVLFLNPGSAGPRRFKLPVCVALLHIQGKALNVKLVELEE